MVIGEVGDHIDAWEGLQGRFLEQLKTADGFSFVFFCQDKVFWWACGGCWVYSDPTDDVADLKQHAAEHLMLCNVTSTGKRTVWTA